MGKRCEYYKKRSKIIKDYFLCKKKFKIFCHIYYRDISKKIPSDSGWL